MNIAEQRKIPRNIKTSSSVALGISAIFYWLRGLKGLPAIS